jgi:hypothetical protein
MKRFFNASVGLILILLYTVIFYQNCGGGGGGAGGENGNPNNKQSSSSLGTFIDDPVSGIYYSTSSGLSGYTDAFGQFQFNPGDTVTFSALGVSLGSFSPTISGDGTASVTPLDLVPGADVSDPKVTAIAQILGTLNAVSAALGDSGSGIFTLPADSGQLSGLVLPTSSGDQQAFMDALLGKIQTAFPLANVTVISTADAQDNLAQGIATSAFAGTIWNASATDGGAKLYLRSDGAVRGVSNDGEPLGGTWSAVSTSKANIHIIPLGEGGGYVDGELPGTGLLHKYENGGYTGETQTITFTKYSSAGVGNTAIMGYWNVTYTPYAVSEDDHGGCANLIAGPGFYFAVTNSKQQFGGSLPDSGMATGSFSDGDHSIVLNFNLSTGTGTVKQNGVVTGTLSFSRSGYCPKDHNDNNGESDT